MAYYSSLHTVLLLFTISYCRYMITFKLIFVLPYIESYRRFMIILSMNHFIYSYKYCMITFFILYISKITLL